MSLFKTLQNNIRSLLHLRGLRDSKPKYNLRPISIKANLSDSRDRFRNMETVGKYAGLV